MKRLIAVAAMIFAFAAHADEFSFKGEGVIVTGTAAACSAAIPPRLLVAVMAETGTVLADLKAAEVTINGEIHGACWLRLSPTRVFVMDVRGGFGYIDVPASM
jgi:hypothetical protein